jgi:hypothetical protein
MILNQRCKDVGHRWRAIIGKSKQIGMDLDFVFQYVFAVYISESRVTPAGFLSSNMFLPYNLHINVLLNMFSPSVWFNFCINYIRDIITESPSRSITPHEPFVRRICQKKTH